MKSNAALQKDVQDAIRWEPLLNAAEIGVTAKDGIVTLTGVVDSYDKKVEAENAAKRVLGVKAVAEEIVVEFHNGFHKKDDSEIAANVWNALDWNTQVPNNKLSIVVEDGWVTVDGEYEWNYQKTAVNDCIKNLAGIAGLHNNIEIRSNSEEMIEARELEAAFKRNRTIGAVAIKVAIVDHHVTLTGSVNAWDQKEEASRIAWDGRGVWSVDNQLAVEFY